jgi:hypothetical protein
VVQCADEGRPRSEQQETQRDRVAAPVGVALGELTGDRARCSGRSNQVVAALRPIASRNPEVFARSEGLGVPIPGGHEAHSR